MREALLFEDSSQPDDHATPAPDVKPEPLEANELQHWIRQGRHVVVDAAAETRLDRYLSQRYTYRTRTQWVQIIKSGRIRVNGQSCRPSQSIRVGAIIAYDPEPITEPEVRRDIGIIHEDAHLIVIHKPGDLPVHPSGRYFKNTLLSILLTERGQTLDAPGFRVVHRLDRETSGVLIFGKTREATSCLATQFEKRKTRKHYLAVVHGSPPEDEFLVDAPLGPRQGSRIRKAIGVVGAGEGKSAQTKFRVLARSAEHTLLEVQPRTGRLHQIRVHSHHAGFPIVGDKMYGLSEEFFLTLADGNELSPEDRERLCLERQALHAWKLEFKHPEDGRVREFTAPLPSDLIQLCRDLGIEVPADVL